MTLFARGVVCIVSESRVPGEAGRRVEPRSNTRERVRVSVGVVGGGGEEVGRGRPARH